MALVELENVDLRYLVVVQCFYNFAVKLEAVREQLNRWAVAEWK